MDYQELTDQEVVARARNGAEAAYRELIGRYQRPILSLIHRLVRDRELAEDLTQDTFVKVLNALDRYDPRLKFSSWIFRIAHNTAIDQLRRKNPVTHSIDGSPYVVNTEEAQASAFTPVDPAEDPEQFASSREIGREIESALAELRPEYRTAIILWHVEGRPYDEIAEIMELPLGTVKTFIHRGRNQLKKRLAHLRA